MRKSARFVAVVFLALMVLSGATSSAENTKSYVGNVQSKVFHLLTCRYADCKNCTRHFESRDEAIETGYRPGGCCHP